MKKTASSIHVPTVARMLAGGALIGGGAASLTGLLRRLSSIKQRGKSLNPGSAADDHVLYVNLPKKKKKDGEQVKRAMAANEGNNMLTVGLGGTSAILGSMVTYNLVRRMIQEQRRKELQADLDQAQQVYLDNVVKTSGFSFPAVAGGSLGILGLLTALGSAAVTNHIMEKRMPSVRKPKQLQPRRVVVRTTEEDDDSVSPDEAEAMMQTHLMSKNASASGVDDLVNHVALNGLTQVKEALQTGGYDMMFGLCKKTASAGPIKRQMAVTAICNDGMLSNAVLPLVAAEEYDRMGPMFMKMASADPEVAKDLRAIAGHVAANARSETFEPIRRRLKHASALESLILPEPLSSLALASSMDSSLQRMAGNGEGEKRHTLNVPASEESVEHQEQDTDTDVVPTDVEAEEFLGMHGDEIDAVLKAHAK